MTQSSATPRKFCRLTYKAWFFGHLHLDLINARQHFYWLFHDVLQLRPDGSINKVYSRTK